MFKAIKLDRDAEKKVHASIVDLNDDALPEGNVTVQVEYSTLNYKDGLVLNGLGGLAKSYPHVPGVDFSGIVAASNDDRYVPGDRVVLTGWRVGELHWGGYAGKARVDANWLVKLPATIDTRQAMAIGTAGLAAMLGLMTIESAGVTPDRGPILVTGAAGGVGSVACSLLAASGYTVEASTGRESTHQYLTDLGVSRIIPRAELEISNGRPMNKEVWAACIDSVGGSTLATVLTQLRYGGAAAAIGLAGGNALDTTVIPFLLRGISLLGVDSVMCPYETRMQAWNRLAEELPFDQLEGMIREVTLAEVPALGKAIVDGQVQGRVVVDVNR